MVALAFLGLKIRLQHSMHLQHQIGSDIMMQLDDVVHSSVTGERLEEATLRSVRWLDRCLAVHEPFREKQNLFAIVQGGLNAELRVRCVEEMLKRADKIPGFAIGGLSGGESKVFFFVFFSFVPFASFFFFF